MIDTMELDTVSLTSERETATAVRRTPQVHVAAAPTRIQWPWGMVSVLGLTILAVIPFVR